MNPNPWSYSGVRWLRSAASRWIFLSYCRKTYLPERKRKINRSNFYKRTAIKWNRFSPLSLKSSPTYFYRSISQINFSKFHISAAVRTLGLHFLKRMGNRLLSLGMKGIEYSLSCGRSLTIPVKRASIRNLAIGMGIKSVQAGRLYGLTERTSPSRF